MFRITLGKGFQMKFPNGLTVSVQFGTSNYCSNRVHDFPSDWMQAQRDAGETGSPDAEVAVMDEAGQMLDLSQHEVFSGDDDSAGCVLPMQVVSLLACVASMKRGQTVVPPCPELPY